MSEDSLSGLLVVLLLILVHAVLTLLYAALTNARTSVLRDLAESGSQRARHALLLVASTSLTITFQLISTLLLFVIASVSVLAVADPLIVLNPEWLPWLVQLLTLLLVGVLTVILGSVVPEAAGSSYANQLVLWAAAVMGGLITIFGPLVQAVLLISQLISRLLGSDTMVNTITEEEIMTLVDAGHTGGTIEEEEKDMIYSVLQLDQTHVSEVMVPRIDVTAVEINQSLDDASKVFVQSGYSRIPVYENHIDNIRGLLYAKDLLSIWSNGEGHTISDLMRPAYFVPETKRADELLKELQLQKVHMAIVVDEYGGTAGLVTIENIIEEIIGDIQDEYDLNEEAEYEEIGPYEYTVDASIDLDDFNELLDVDLPTEDSDTLGGFIYTYFGRVPVVGEVIDTEHLLMDVVSVDGRRIRKVHVIRKNDEEENGESFSENDSREALSDSNEGGSRD